MGVWLKANGRLEVVPPPDDRLLVEFWEFSRATCPDDYTAIDERFANTWFFDENNKLACIAGKFAEPSVWYKWMKTHFFEPKGYRLVGDCDIVGECDPGVDIFDIEILKEYYAWLRRVARLSEDAANFILSMYRKNKIEEVVFDEI